MLSLTFNTLLILSMIAFIFITLILFAQVHLQNYNPKHVFWNRMNLFAAVVIAATLLSVVPQLFISGRTLPQCRLLHLLAGCFYNLTNAMVRLFFLVRSEMVVPRTRSQSALWRSLLLLWTLNASLSAIGMFLYISVAERDGVCIVEFQQTFVLLNSIVLPIAFDLVVNARFVYFVSRTSAAAGMMDGATRRLLRVTCLLSLSTMAVSILVACVLMGAIPLRDGRQLTPILVVEQVYNACMMAWPAIIIRYMKTSEAAASTSQARVGHDDGKPGHVC